MPGRHKFSSVPNAPEINGRFVSDGLITSGPTVMAGYKVLCPNLVLAFQTVSRQKHDLPINLQCVRKHHQLDVGTMLRSGNSMAPPRYTGVLKLILEICTRSRSVVFDYRGGIMLTTRSVVSIFSAAMMILGAGMAAGQDYPTKPIRILTGGLGSGNDFTARQVAQGISGPLGQSVIVENRITVQATEAAAKSPPDGYTLFVGGNSTWIRTLLSTKMPWDVVRDFAPVTLTDSAPNLIVVHPSLPAKTIKELIAFAKARPGQLNYGSPGIGTTDHLMGELFKSLAGVNIVHVSYTSPGAAAIALRTGEVQVAYAITTMDLVRAGKLRALAITGTKPSALFPGVPTATTSGLPGFEFSNIATVMAPAKTPAAIIRRLNQEMVRYLTRPEVTKRFLDFGVEVVASSPEELAAYRDADIARISKVIKDAGIPVER